MAEVVLDAPFTQPARVADDIIEVDEHTWAIHGVTPVGGEVLLAEFATPEEAHAVLERLAIGGAGWHGTGTDDRG
jgi:hypothetical protein